MDTSKIIRGVVSNGRYTVTAPIVKEDYGLYLKIEGLELPSTYEVDFSNSENNGTSVTMIGNADGVLIPRQFIDSGKDVFAFLYHVGANYGRTVYKFRIPNKVRPDRTNEEPTPEEQSVIDQAISALNTAVVKTAQDVISADQSARSASDDADRAESARDTAQTYANNAQASATSASQSATASANSASQAHGYAQTASAKAQDASQSATNASNSATTASTKAGEASASATTASNKASEASGYATTASNKATEASGYANTASQKASDAESAKTAAQTAQGLAEGARDSAISAKNDAEQAKADAESARDEAVNAVASISGALDDKADIITDTASGSIASFSDGADDLPLKSLVVDINPIQDLSNGDPSPENICPISGWTEVDVEQRGKNLFPFGAEVIAVGNKSFAQSEPIIRKGQTVTLSADVEWGSGYTSSVVFLLRSNNSGISNILFNTTKRSGTWTATEDVYGFNFYATSSGATNPGVTTIYRNIQLELGSTATPYSPYAGRSITINLGQTVYGGKLDVLSGVLVIDRAMLTATECSSVSTASTGVLYASVSVATGTIAKAEASSNKNISSVYKYRVNAPTDGGWFRVTTNNIYIFDNRFTDKATADTILFAEQPVFVYELATPIEIQLSANQVNSLLGVNNIWADSGDTEVEYRADTKAYIAKKIAEAIASLT